MKRKSAWLEAGKGLLPPQSVCKTWMSGKKGKTESRRRKSIRKDQNQKSEKEEDEDNEEKERKEPEDGSDRDQKKDTDGCEKQNAERSEDFQNEEKLTDQRLLRKGSDDDVKEADGGYEGEGSFEETND